eukprot:10208434-Lingulodinium_polyedra.AAC.1
MPVDYALLRRGSNLGIKTDPHMGLRLQNKRPAVAQMTVGPKMPRRAEVATTTEPLGIPNIQIGGTMAHGL